MKEKQPTIKEIFEKIYDKKILEFIIALLEDPYVILFDRSGFILPDDCEEHVKDEKSELPGRKTLVEDIKCVVPGIKKIESKSKLPKEQDKSK